MRRFNSSQPRDMAPVLHASETSWRARMDGLLAVLLTFVVLMVAACSQSQVSATTSNGTPATTHQSTTRASSTSDTLPAFSDWRASYLSSDGHVHAITFDGTNDLTGPELPNLSFAGLNFASAGFAPNGHVLAYDAAPGLTIVDVATKPMVTHTVNLAAMYQLAWSPDGSELAAGDGVSSVYTVSAAGGQPHQVQVQPLPQGWQASIDLLGWIDGSHVAVTLVPNGPIYTASDGSTYVAAVGLGALDVTSGQLRVVATISFAGLGTPSFILSPDGKTALFYNRGFRDNPFTPDVELIDTQSGAREQLTGIAQVTQAGFSSVAWQPGTQTIAVTDGNLQSWILDTQHDVATKLLAGHSVAGWAPNNGPLIVTTAGQLTIGSGPFDISAVTISPGGQISTTLLTQAAWTFPFVGFVRTAT